MLRVDDWWKVAAVMTVIAVAPTASQNYGGCIRLSSSGQGMTITKLCNANLYVEWEDGRGEHVTAVGPNASMHVGRISGQAHVTGVNHQ